MYQYRTNVLVHFVLILHIALCVFVGPICYGRVWFIRIAIDWPVIWLGNLRFMYRNSERNCNLHESRKKVFAITLSTLKCHHKLVSMCGLVHFIVSCYLASCPSQMCNVSMTNLTPRITHACELSDITTALQFYPDHIRITYMRCKNRVWTSPNNNRHLSYNIPIPPLIYPQARRQVQDVARPKR